MQSFEEIFYLIELMGFGFSTVLTAVFAGQIYLRYKEPDLHRPIKVALVKNSCLASLPPFRTLTLSQTINFTLIQTQRVGR